MFQAKERQLKGEIKRERVLQRQKPASVRGLNIQPQRLHYGYRDYLNVPKQIEDEGHNSRSEEGTSNAGLTGIGHAQIVKTNNMAEVDGMEIQNADRVSELQHIQSLAIEAYSNRSSATGMADKEIPIANSFQALENLKSLTAMIQY